MRGKRRVPGAPIAAVQHRWRHRRLDPDAIDQPHALVGQVKYDELYLSTQPVINLATQGRVNDGLVQKAPTPKVSALQRLWARRRRRAGFEMAELIAELRSHHHHRKAKDQQHADDGEEKPPVQRPPLRRRAERRRSAKKVQVRE